MAGEREKVWKEKDRRYNALPNSNQIQREKEGQKTIRAHFLRYIPFYRIRSVRRVKDFQPWINPGEQVDSLARFLLSWREG